MKKTIVFAMAFLTVLMIGMFPMRTLAAKGPRSTMDVIWYTDPNNAFTALTNGEADIMQWALTETQKEAAEANPNLQVASYTENGIFEFDLNCEQYILTYPLTDSPTYNVDVRRALACLTDKDYIISNILNNYGSRLDAPVCYPQTVGWVDNPGVVTFDWSGNGLIEPSEDNFPWNYDIAHAVELLVTAGFSDTDADGYLNYPASWPGIGALPDTKTQSMPLKICIRVDDPLRTAAGRLLVAALEGNPVPAGDSALALSPRWAELGKVGGDFDTTDITFEAVRAVLRPIVMRDFDYHVYTGGWSFGRFPTYEYTLFHSIFHYPYGPNYVIANDPTYDTLVRAVYFAPNLAASQAACKAATTYHVNQCVNIPLWSFTSYVAWRKELAGVVNMKGYGIVNDYTFLNAYRTNAPASPLRAAAVSSWSILNVMYSQWYFEYLMLDRVTNGLIAVNPYDLAADIPWGAQDWTTGSWVDGRDGITKSTVTYYLRPDQGAAEPVTGNFAGFYDAKDYEWNAWFNYAYDDDWQWSSFMDINHIEVVDCQTVKVYFEDTSMWFIYSPTYPLLGPATVLTDLLCGTGTQAFTGASLVNPGGTSDPSYFEYAFTTDRVVQIKSATKNGVPMTENVDYYVRGGYDVMPNRGIFANMTTILPTDNIVIDYTYALPGGASGTYVGGDLGYDFEDTMYAYGYMYPLSISVTSASLNKNPYFFLTTPLLGEVDWRWYYNAGPTPRTGQFKIDILDVVKVTGAYCSRGDGIFNPVYLPGADLDGSDLCHIGILDLVTITGKYAQTFGTVPASTLGVVGDLNSRTPTPAYEVTGPHLTIPKIPAPTVADTYQSAVGKGVTQVVLNEQSGYSVTSMSTSGGGSVSFGTTTVTINKNPGTYYCGDITLSWTDGHKEYIHFNLQN